MIVIAASSFLMMNFTGSSTYASPSGVKKEMKLFVPIQAVLAVIGIINRFVPTYGVWFLQTIDSLYPGYHALTGLKSMGVGVGYALFDGLIGGALFAWVYNLASGCCCKEKEEAKDM